MATKKISELPLADALTGSEVIPVVQDGITKKIDSSYLVGPEGPAGGPTIGFATKALMDLAVAYPDGTLAVVTDDPTEANNGTWRWDAQTAAWSQYGDPFVRTATLAEPEGASLVGFQQAGTGAVARTEQEKGRELVSVGDFGTVGVSEAADNALFDAAVASIASAGVVINPHGSLVNFETVTVPVGVMVLDMPGGRLIASEVGVGKSEQGGGTHLLIRDIRDATGTRAHIEPNGYATGTRTKLDWMFDPYEEDGVNYRIINRYTHDDHTLPTAGYAFDGVKAVGTHFGIWPRWHMGFSDAGSTSVPMTMYYFDTSDTSWRTPFKGAWRTGKTVAIGDHVTASNKLYVAASAGDCGATVPSHAAGTVSDGAVDWTFVRDFAAASSSIKPCVLFGERDDLPKFGHSTVRVQHAGDVAFWNAKNLKFLNNGGSETYRINTHNLVDDLYIESADLSRSLRFGSTFIQWKGVSELLASKTITDGSATPTVTGAQVVIFSNTGATNVTAMTGQPYQRLVIQAGNGNTTLVHGANIILNTGANKTLTANSCLEFVFNAGGTIAREIGCL